MGSDALRQLREWQRREAGAQDQALRAATRAWVKLERSDNERAAIVKELADAVASLESSGVPRDQAAALLGVSPTVLGRMISGRTGARPDSAGPS